MAPKYMSIRDFALAYDLSTITIRRRIKDGTLPAVQMGGPGTSWRIPLNGHAVNPATVISSTPQPPAHEAAAPPTKRAKTPHARQPHWLKNCSLM